jgi:hypothetical protein
VVTITTTPVANRQIFVDWRIVSCGSTAFWNCTTAMIPRIASGMIQSTRRRIDSSNPTPEIAHTRPTLNRSRSLNPRMNRPTTTTSPAKIQESVCVSEPGVVSAR